MVSSGTFVDESLIWLLVRGRGVKKIFQTPTPNEKPNENLTCLLMWGVGRLNKIVDQNPPNQKPTDQ